MKNGWSVGHHSNERLEGLRTIGNGKYRWEVAAREDFIWSSTVKIKNLSDFYLAVDIQHISGPMTSASYGVVFRVDDDDYYLFEIAGGNFCTASLQIGDEWITLIDWTHMNIIKTREVNRLAVVANGSHFLFFINDQYVGEVEDSRLATGRVGLSTGLWEGDEAVFEFDNFELRAPSSE